jgi:GNAT superfamily N-acetyltransferase
VTLNAEPALRQASAEDVAAITACVQRAYAKYADRMTQPPKPVLADYAAVVRSRPTWLLEHAGQCVGVLVLVPEADRLLLENVAVDPAHQGRGLGRLLLDFTEAEALRLGLPGVRLYTNALMTENVAIYTARGYVETERREMDGRTVVFMQKSVTAHR